MDTGRTGSRQHPSSIDAWVHSSSFVHALVSHINVRFADADSLYFKLSPTTGTLLQYLLQLQHNRVANFTVATIGSIAIPYHDGLCKAPTGEKRLYLTVTCHHQSLSPLLDIFMFFGGSINWQRPTHAIYEPKDFLPRLSHVQWYSGLQIRIKYEIIKYEIIKHDSDITWVHKKSAKGGIASITEYKWQINHDEQVDREMSFVK